MKYYLEKIIYLRKQIALVETILIKDITSPWRQIYLFTMQNIIVPGEIYS